LREIAREGAQAEGEALAANALMPNDYDERAASANIRRMRRKELTKGARGIMRRLAIRCRMTLNMSRRER